MSGALIVTAALGQDDLSWLNSERTEHFPPERNYLKAHLTMFHALPPSCEDEVGRLLATLASEFAPPAARLSEVMFMGRGVAYRVHSDELQAIRSAIQARFEGMLTAQDQGGWRPHVTIQNKVDKDVARALYDQKKAAFDPRALAIRGLTLNRYLGGPWEELGSWSFRGKARA
ncbi:2'-5' RNA ligase family protein [Sphingomicrobium sp. XHP0239]|uniref:2'-5' RNA ligase family protein n=1 Tax=Sphingomicrobium maritimum TaxID=3133972 RepID=UPI0031CC4942